jgi:hypothetical protein
LVGLADSYEEAGSQPFPKTCGHDETAFVIKAMFDRTGEQGPFRCQKGTPLGTITIH